MSTRGTPTLAQRDRITNALTLANTLACKLSDAITQKLGLWPEGEALLSALGDAVEVARDELVCVLRCEHGSDPEHCVRCGAARSASPEHPKPATKRVLPRLRTRRAFAKGPNHMSNSTAYVPRNVHSRTDYVAHFNQIIGNYAEALVAVPRDPVEHRRAAGALDRLMNEYALATDLLDQVRGDVFGAIEISKNEGGQWASVAHRFALSYPMLEREIEEFVSDLDAYSVDQASRINLQPHDSKNL